MGGSASKGSSRKRTARESWYAPVSRCSSAPIHYVPDIPNDGNDLSRTSQNRTEPKAPPQRFNKNSLGSMLEEEEVESVKKATKDTAENGLGNLDFYRPNKRDEIAYGYEPRKRAALCEASSRYNPSLNPVPETYDWNNQNTDAMGTWKPVEWLHKDDNGCLTSSSHTVKSLKQVFEKSQSFNKVHGLDSCFSESYLRVCHTGSIRHGKNSEEGYIPNEKTGLCVNEDGVLISTAKSPIASPESTLLNGSLDSPSRNCYKDPLGSPSKSPLVGSTSPLFDPSLLAKFEQAVDTTVAWKDDLCRYSGNDESINTSSSLFSNTWESSETSSNGESLQSSPRGNSHTEAEVQSTCTGDICQLERFEMKCPPNGKDKVVLYFTSLRGVRKTYENCHTLRHILQGLGIQVDERDVWMHAKFREELTELLDSKKLQVPRLFIKGRYIGGVDEVCQLHEDGFLTRLIRDMPSYGSFRKPCEGCANMRFIPCITCHGSCKLMDGLDQMIRCSECNENGLILCPLCS
ncbi:hypothetical protein KP509_35G044200 [Ceratopteris richardii]|uniref:Glutaredoxin domain-containing protein n=1 Tax=Ceratopteris richardii TaxID=49495 RepID=A0A8T2QFN2_CERRI|nr:hypothetical protein KP509_35G044200 [Ceratopteris richardii]